MLAKCCNRACLLLVALFCLAPSIANAQFEKPNIVYILVDNWGWGDIGVQGSTIATSSGLNETKESVLGFLMTSSCAIVYHAYRNIIHGYRHRSTTA